MLSVSSILIIRAGDDGPPPLSQFFVLLDILSKGYSIIRFILGIQNQLRPERNLVRAWPLDPFLALVS